MFELNNCRTSLTVSGLGSRILRISDLAPLGNTAGNEYSALSICIKEKRPSYRNYTFHKMLCLRKNVLDTKNTYAID
jgi:hypothetical protein